MHVVVITIDHHQRRTLDHTSSRWASHSRSSAASSSAAAAGGGGGGGGGGGAADDGALAPLLQRRLDDAENEVRTQAQEVEQLQQLLSEAQRHADAALGAARGVKRG